MCLVETGSKHVRPTPRLLLPEKHIIRRSICDAAIVRLHAIKGLPLQALGHQSPFTKPSSFSPATLE